MSIGRIVRVNGVDLCVDTVGDVRDPAILLISGAGASMDWWEDEFCQRLAAGGRFVIRYDNRDTGQSVTYPVGVPPYTGRDLANDAVGVLDALDLRSAHLVGISMGGAIVQLVAVDHPDRVDSLVLISTSPAGPVGPGNPQLPPMSEELRAYFAAQAAPPDWSDRATAVDAIVDSERRFAAPEYFDEAHVRQLADRIVDRSTDMAASMTNHWLINDDEPVQPVLAEVAAPALVIHGTADPLFPYGHAEALAREIPRARLLPLAGVGHQMPPMTVWAIVIPAILRHTSGGWDAQGGRLASRSVAAGDPTGWFDRLYAAGMAGEVPVPWDRQAPHPLLVQWAQVRGLDRDGPKRDDLAQGQPGVEQLGGGQSSRSQATESQPSESQAAEGQPSGGQPNGGQSNGGEAGGGGRRAVVVGCGLGADAEYVAGLGYETTAFDIAETAIRVAQQRYPATTVRYVKANLLDLPGEWLRAYDLVVEIFTVQALPDPPRHAAIAAVEWLVAPGGTLIVIAFRQDQPDAQVSGPPWPLKREEIDAFAADDLSLIRIEKVNDPRMPNASRWRAEFKRPA